MFNFNKGNLLLPGIILLGLLLFTAVNLWAVNALTFRAATFDINKILKESVIGQELNTELQKKYNEIGAKAKVAKSDAERSQLQAQFDQYKTQKQNDFLNKVKETIAKVAKKQGIKAVASPQVFVYSEVDLTDKIIKELAK